MNYKQILGILGFALGILIFIFGIFLKVKTNQALSDVKHDTSFPGLPIGKVVEAAIDPAIHKYQMLANWSIAGGVVLMVGGTILYLYSRKARQ